MTRGQCNHFLTDIFDVHMYNIRNSVVTKSSLFEYYVLVLEFIEIDFVMSTNLNLIIITSVSF